MELQEAISQISTIHSQVLRGEIFRGYRALPVAITSVLAIAAAAAQVYWITPRAIAPALVLWAGYAALGGVICGADLLVNCMVRGRRFRQQAVLALAQFAPAFAAGVIVTAVVGGVPSARPLLPGLWTLLYALGICASLPYLPRALGFVAAFYVAAGGYLLGMGAHDGTLSAVSMGATFAAGQAAIAVILHVRLERGQ